MQKYEIVYSGCVGVCGKEREGDEEPGNPARRAKGCSKQRCLLALRTAAGTMKLRGANSLQNESQRTRSFAPADGGRGEKSTPPQHPCRSAGKANSEKDDGWLVISAQFVCVLGLPRASLSRKRKVLLLVAVSLCVPLRQAGLVKKKYLCKRTGRSWKSPTGG